MFYYHYPFIHSAMLFYCGFLVYIAIKRVVKEDEYIVVYVRSNTNSILKYVDFPPIPQSVNVKN